MSPRSFDRLERKKTSQVVDKEEHYKKLGFVFDEDGNITCEDVRIDGPIPPTASDVIPERRLAITCIKLHNFKSFYGEHTVGPFEKNFTCITGPNGSGKSNIIDALRFVFGSTSKKLRTQKAGNLIHQSKDHKNLDSCSVTAYFAMIRDLGGDKSEIIENTEFYIRRTTQKGGNSFYELNGKKKHQKEIIEFLKTHNIDLIHHRFLILQGEIENISTMKPKSVKENEDGLLEYVEDIIGSNRFIKPIDQFEVKCEDVQRRLDFARSDLTRAETDKLNLEGPKNEALEHYRNENKVVVIQNSLFHITRHAAEKEVEEIVKDKDEIADKLKVIKEEFKKVQKEGAVKESEIESLSKLEKEALRNVEHAKESLTSLTNEHAALKDRYKNRAKRKQNLEKEHKSENDELAKLEKQIEMFKGETNELETKKVNLQEVLATAKEKESGLESSIKTQSTKYVTLKEQKEEELKKARNKENKAVSELDLVEGDIRSLTSEETHSKQKLDSTKSAHAKLDTGVKKMADDILELENQISALESESPESVENELNSLKESAVTLQEKIRSEESRQNEANSAYRSYNNNNATLSAFEKAKSKGKFPGFFGRLGDLGGISEKYDIAISTASPMLDHFVTDTAETTIECVKFLKANNLGYKTFLPLDRLQNLNHQANSKITVPEGSKRLYDLIDIPDPKFKVVFYRSLYNTLVVDDINQATRIAFGVRRHRVVTLTGELIETAGTLSGGGKAMRGKMGKKAVKCLVSKAELDEIASNLAELHAERKRILSKIDELNDHKNKYEGKIKQLTHRRKMLKTTYTDDLTRLKVLQRQVSEQEIQVQQTKVDPNMLKELQDKIKEKQKVVSETKKVTSALTEEVSELNNEIKKLTSGEYKKAKKAVSKLTEEVATISNNITKSLNNVKIAQKKVKKKKDDVEKSLRDMQKIDLEIQELTSKESKFGESIKELKELQERSTKEAVEHKAKRKALDEELHEFRAAEKKLKNSEMECKDKLKVCEEKEKQNRDKIKLAKHKIKGLQLQVVEDDPTELPTLTAEDIEGLVTDTLMVEMNRLNDIIKKTVVDNTAIEKYKAKEAIYNERLKIAKDLQSESEIQRSRLAELNQMRLSEFMEGFKVIEGKLKEAYMMLTGTGSTLFECASVKNPFESGLNYYVRPPPNKGWHNLQNVSGGERTLGSLALVFALHYYRPTPFYVMDEIDSALDRINVALVGQFLSHRAKNTQFIVVSHRDLMLEQTPVIIGVTKVRNCAQIIYLGFIKYWSDNTDRKTEWKSKIVPELRSL